MRATQMSHRPTATGRVATSTEIVVTIRRRENTRSTSGNTGMKLTRTRMIAVAKANIRTVIEERIASTQENDPVLGHGHDLGHASIVVMIAATDMPLSVIDLERLIATIGELEILDFSEAESLF